jgi:phosphoserine aminotransferase
MPTNFSMAPIEMPTSKGFNFGAERGPIAKQVLRMTQSQVVSYNGSYLSVFDMSRKSKEFKAIESRAKDSLRQLLQIPEDFTILFQQGGAATQHAAVVYNLLGPGKT